MDYVGISQNERAQNNNRIETEWLKYFTTKIKQEPNYESDYKHIKLVAADGYRDTKSISRVLLDHPDLIDEIDVISSHYGLTGSTELNQLQAKLIADGKKPKESWVSENYRIYAKGDRQTSYTIRGLKDSKHTAKVVIKGGTFTLDGIDVVTGRNKVEVNKTKLQELYDANQDKDHKVYVKESWDTFHKALQSAKMVLQNPETTLEQVVAARTSLQAAVEGLTEITSE